MSAAVFQPKPTICALAVAGLLTCFGPVLSHAQTQPDAGRTLQSVTPPLQAPAARQSLDVQAPHANTVAPGGPKIAVSELSFSGNTVFTQAQLQAVLGRVSGERYDLAGLQGLAARITAHYRDAGYRFALAYLPPQDLAQGAVQISVVEGRFGNIQVTADAELQGAAHKFLGALKPDAVIDNSTLEHTVVVLASQPGVKVVPILRPGQRAGTGDLDVQVTKDKPFAGELTLDNTGNRYTGQTTARANLQFNSPFILGDQVTARLLGTEENMWNGALGYNLPMGVSGWRANVGYSRSIYTLGKEFAALKAQGSADTYSVGVSYPLLLSPQSNVNVGATLQAKRLNDQQGSTNSQSDKSSTSLPIELRFDHRDASGSGAISYGTVTWTPGDLHLDSTLRAQDTSGGRRSEGSFNKLNVDVARVQALWGNFSVFGKVAAQWADKNLDSSEGFTLGGAYGVRAYPNGEAAGDAGWLAQVELRYALGAWSPYVFHDAGQISTNAKPDTITPAVTRNQRALAGSGVGVRFASGAWSVDAKVAWRNEGGNPQADSDTSDRRAWLSISTQF